MINKYVAIFLLGTLAFEPSFASPALSGMSSEATAVSAVSPGGNFNSLPCQTPTSGSSDRTEVAGGDCCTGHQGVCGCRAGKIVCCDGTTSPNCTCHADDTDSVAN